MKHKLLVAVEGGMDSLATVVYAAKACAGAEVPEEGGRVILHVLPPHRQRQLTRYGPTLCPMLWRCGKS